MGRVEVEPASLAGPGIEQDVAERRVAVAQAFAPWLFGVCLDRWSIGALWLSGSLGLAAFAALLFLPRAVAVSELPTPTAASTSSS